MCGCANQNGKSRIYYADVIWARRRAGGGTGMRLGVVMMGAGAYAAASIGVLSELSRRQIEPCAVCGMLGGAWPAALYAAGRDEDAMYAAMQQTAAMGRRLLTPAQSGRALLKKGRPAIADGARLERLLVAQAGQKILSLCPRPAVFLCRTARVGHPVIFSTRPYAQESGAMLTMQASVSFAARAAMTLPPVLAPVSWMGSTLLPHADAAMACRQLFALGAHRVLVIAPQPSPRGALDALDLAAMTAGFAPPEGEHIGVLRVQMPDGISALAFDQLEACHQAGALAAQRELDAVFERLGMAFCHVLPFRRSQA